MSCDPYDSQKPYNDSLMCKHVEAYVNSILLNITLPPRQNKLKVKKDGDKVTPHEEQVPDLVPADEERRPVNENQSNCTEQTDRLADGKEGQVQESTTEELADDSENDIASNDRNREESSTVNGINHDRGEEGSSGVRVEDNEETAQRCQPEEGGDTRHREESTKATQPSEARKDGSVGAEESDKDKEEDEQEVNENNREDGSDVDEGLGDEEPHSDLEQGGLEDGDKGEKDDEGETEPLGKKRGTCIGGVVTSLSELGPITKA